VKPSAGTPAAAAAAQQRLRIVQWAIPAITGALTVISAVQGEQQKPASQATRLTRMIGDRLAG
jgi:hypothetical protein